MAVALAGMSYSLGTTDQSLSAGIRRIAREQIDRALEEAADDAIPEAERIHQLRKRCKKLRGLIRLVRPGFRAYPAENAAFRKIANRLSDVRDARAFVETCEALTSHFSDELDDDGFSNITGHFDDAAEAAEDAPDLDKRLAKAVDALKLARDRAEAWVISPDGADSIRAGLEKTYARAVKAMAKARKEPTGRKLHEWRKRTKYHWYHLRLLQEMSPVVEAAANQTRDLADLLGDHHDLHVMGDALDAAGRIADPSTLTAFRALMQARQDTLEREAFQLGRMVFAEPPKAAARRRAAYWAIRMEEAG